MSQEICEHCGKKTSTTCDPNSYEGFFISDVEVDKLDGDELSYHHLKKSGIRRAFLCPSCGKLMIEGGR